ncbi:MAG: S8 family serine peptidase, partial [Thermofilum sp.]|nr:S8 family serine peptidase [Thermofilum sp.]
AKEVKPVAPGKTKLVMSLAKFESEEAAQAAEKQLKKNPKVVLVAKNKLLRIPPVIKEQVSFAPSAATKDPLRPYQWWLDKIKDNIAPPPTGDTGRLVAVLDSGVDYYHEDLQGQVVLGYDWVNYDTDPYDDNGHGTHVAGIIAAKRDNLKGIAGIAPNYKVYAVKVCDAYGSCPLDAIINGIYEAASNPYVDVISMSLGGYAAVGSAEYILYCTACSYAMQQGKAVVATAGNEGNLYLYYFDLGNGVVGDHEVTVVPAGCPGVIGVAATDEHDFRAFFSNYAIGALSDLAEFAAPGWAVLSTVPGNGYEAWYGTSMATPIVSAAIARVKAYWGYANVFDAVNRLLSTGTTLGSSNGFPVPTRRVDIARALGYTGSGIQGYVYSAEGYEGPLGELRSR